MCPHNAYSKCLPLPLAMTALLFSALEAFTSMRAGQPVTHMTSLQ